MFAAGNAVDDFAALIENFDFQIAEDVTPALVVSDLRIVGTATPVKTFIPLRPSALCLEVLDNWLARDKRCFLAHQVRSQLAQRGNVVDDPDATSVRRQD